MLSKARDTLSLYQKESWLIFIDIDRYSFHASHFKSYGVEVIFSRVEDISSKLDCEALPALCSYRRAWMLSFFSFIGHLTELSRVLKVITLRKVKR